MISPEDLERERELARIKVERDQLSRLESAFLDGYEEGLLMALEERGVEIRLDARDHQRIQTQLLNRIYMCQRHQKKQLHADRELLALPLPELRRFVHQLEKETFG